MRTSARKLLVLISFVAIISLPALAETRSAPNTQSVSQKAELGASNAQSFSFVGTSVAMSGDTVVVGAPGVSNTGYSVPGAAYVYVEPAKGWQNMAQVAELTTSDGGDCPACNFGESVAISGNTILIGNSMGEAYIYVMPAGGWANMTETARLVGTGLGTCFCGQVAIDGKTIAVGSPVGGNNSGVVYLFVEPAGGWQTTSTPNATLVEPSPTEEDQFGTYVAISGETVVSQGGNGAQNQIAVFVFDEPAGGWTGTISAIATLTSTQQYAKPYSVGVSGNTIAAGSDEPYQTIPFVDIWVKPAGGWTNANETAELTDGTGTQDAFGSAVFVLGNYILASAPVYEVSTGKYRGEVYVYEKPAGGWKTTSAANFVLSNSNWTNEDGFGTSIGASGTTAVVGAPNGPNRSDVGAAYIFQ